MENGRFVDRSGFQKCEQGVHLHGAYVIPGLVDIHIHGAMGADFSDGDYEGLKTMASYLARCGVTSFAPTSMTLPYEQVRYNKGPVDKIKNSAGTTAGFGRIFDFVNRSNA